MGITRIVLSLRYKAPIFTAWSTPGIALLIVALQGVSLSQAGGIFYLLAGLASSAIVGLFLMLPAAVTATIAGLALLPVLSTNMFKAFSDANNQLPPVLAFLTTASGTHFFGINSSFWGLLIGIVAFYLAQRIKAKQAGK